MTRTRVALAISFLVASTGCDGCKKDTAAGPDAASAAAPSASAAPSAAPSADVATTSGKMAHCPNAVDGAKADITDSKDGIVFKITGATPAITSEIRARAKFLGNAASAMNQGTETKQHNGSGEGGGVYGRCPIVMRNTSVEVADVEGGSQVTVKPKDAQELDWLRREARERQHELGEPAAQGAGQGKMGHCPSAVQGAVTTIKDTKDGLEVQVVGKDDATTKEIRERGKSLMDAAKSDADVASHKGDGSGGGGFGRCPVVLTDTKVESKEVAGGLTFTVKPTKAADLAALRKEARDRATNFKVK